MICSTVCVCYAYHTLFQPLYRDMKKTCNIEAYVEWFNRLSYLVATEICVVSHANGCLRHALLKNPQADKRRNRAKLIEFFADTANECRKLNNYNSYMAISGRHLCNSMCA